jgi:hypothetical protein
MPIHSSPLYFAVNILFGGVDVSASDLSGLRRRLVWCATVIVSEQNEEQNASRCETADGCL